MEEQTFLLSADSLGVIRDAHFTVVDDKNRELFETLNQFWNEQLSIQFEDDNFRRYEQMTMLYPFLYEHILQRRKEDPRFDDMYSLVVGTVMRDLRSGIGLPLRMADEVMPVEEKEKYNRYSTVLLNRLAEVFNLCFRNKDWGQLPFLLNQLDYIKNYNQQIRQELFFRIRIMEAADLAGNQLAELELLKREYAAENFTEEAVRLFFKALYFWNVYLYSLGVLSLQEYSDTEQQLGAYKGYIRTNFIEDLVALRSYEMEGRFAWSRWDYKQRFDGPYTPPYLGSWATLGAVIYLLVSRDALYVELENMSPDQVVQYGQLVEAMRERLAVLKEDHFALFAPVLGVADKATYEGAIDGMDNHLEQIQLEVNHNGVQALAVAAVDATRVSNMRRTICETWEKSSVLRQLFVHFGNITYEGAVDDAKRLIGVKNRYWHGYKAALVHDQNLFIPVAGVEKLGEEIAKLEDGYYLSQVLPGAGPATGGFFKVADAAMERLKATGYLPDVILVDPLAWYNQVVYTDQEEFIYDAGMAPAGLSADFGGFYKNTLVIKLRHPLMKNKMIVADFKRSFRLKVQTQDGGYKDIFVNKISTIGAEQAGQLLNNEPGLRPVGYTQEQARNLVMTYMFFDFYLEELLEMVSPEAFIAIRLP